MSKHHHLAHLLDFEPGLKIGMTVERKQLLGRVGKSGTQYAHCHYEYTFEKPTNWTQYIYGLSKDQVMKLYGNPEPYIGRDEGVPAPYTTYGGYEYLSPIESKENPGVVKGFHPGIDINDKSGDQDTGNPVKSPVYGVIVYIGRNEGGWGNHIWIREEEAHWSDTAMDWYLDNKIIEQKKNPNQVVTWGEMAVKDKRMAERILEWARKPL